MRTMEKIFSRLCSYDPRNPDRIPNLEEKQYTTDKKNCYCDNCFYGRTPMTKQIIELLEALEAAKIQIEEYQKMTYEVNTPFKGLLATIDSATNKARGIK